MICNERASVDTQYDTLKAKEEAALELFTQQIQDLKSNQLDMDDSKGERDNLLQKTEGTLEEARISADKRKAMQDEMAIAMLHEKTQHEEEVHNVKMQHKEEVWGICGKYKKEL
ncbi:hypothetical protein scyTo_0000482 [Scyliorhinus torazame]|uniref:Uncharacterized protein n=1 Tax=Scyliorhinus torazame TaxID=75743 RepID=A0A401NYC4_SCYTO|nr:hypothetical protein [Scyliorhinus torazame]